MMYSGREKGCFNVYLMIANYWDMTINFDKLSTTICIAYVAFILAYSFLPSRSPMELKLTNCP